MINKYLFHDLEVIARRIMGKIIFVGDRNQLPPVNQLLSDVFAPNKYDIISLTQVMRSSGDNNILNISNYIRESISNKDNLRLKTFKDDNVQIHRAEKKWLDIKKKLPLKEVKKSLKKRTLTDKNRKHSPLIRVKDSILIRSDQLTKKQVLSKREAFMLKESSKVQHERRQDDARLHKSSRD